MLEAYQVCQWLRRRIFHHILLSPSIRSKSVTSVHPGFAQPPSPTCESSHTIIQNCVMSVPCTGWYDYQLTPTCGANLHVALGLSPVQPDMVAGQCYFTP